MNFNDYVWHVQLLLSIVFAAHVATVARRKGRHPVGAALLLLAFANGWPLAFEAVGRGVASAFQLRDPARLVLTKVFSYGGVMFGVATSYVIVGCLRPLRARQNP